MIEGSKRKRRKSKRGYVYTDKVHSLKGAYASVMGIVSLITMILCIYQTVLLHGEALARYGVAALFALVLCIPGMIVAFFSLMENGKFYLLSYVGILTNALTLVGLVWLLIIGR